MDSLQSVEKQREGESHLAEPPVGQLPTPDEDSADTESETAEQAEQPDAYQIAGRRIEPQGAQHQSGRQRCQRRQHQPPARLRHWTDRQLEGSEQEPGDLGGAGDQRDQRQDDAVKTPDVGGRKGGERCAGSQVVDAQSGKAARPVGQVAMPIDAPKDQQQPGQHRAAGRLRQQPYGEDLGPRNALHGMLIIKKSFRVRCDRSALPVQPAVRAEAGETAQDRRSRQSLLARYRLIEPWESLAIRYQNRTRMRRARGSCVPPYPLDLRRLHPYTPNPRFLSELAGPLAMLPGCPRCGPPRGRQG